MVSEIEKSWQIKSIIRFFSFLEGLNEDGQLLFGSKEKSTKTDAACLISLLFYGTF